MIEIFNMYIIKPSEPYDIKVDRSSPLGNPFSLKFEKDRDIVCDNYHKLFYKRLNSSPEEYKKVKNELQRLKEIYQKYNVLNLYCWCRPKRCHAETIKEYLIKELNKD